MKQWGGKKRVSAKVRDCEAKECWRVGNRKGKMRKNGGRCFGFLRKGDRILKLVVLFEA